VDLFWNARQRRGRPEKTSMSSSVAVGLYYGVNSTVNMDRTYTDTTAIAGQTYFYVAKAVDGDDVQV